MTGPQSGGVRPSPPPVTIANDAELIQALYGSLTHREGFHAFLELLTQSINGCAAQLLLVRKQPLQIEHLWYAGLSDEFLAWYLDNNMIAQDVVSNHAAYQSPGLFQSALPLLPAFNADEDYDKWESEQDMLDTAWLVVHASPTHAQLLTVQRTVAQGPYQDSELQELNRLVPYIRQAAQLYRQIDRRALAANSLAAVIDLLPDATFLLDDQAAIVHANSAARQLVGRERQLVIADQRLAFSDRQVQNAFFRSTVQVVRSSMGREAYSADTLFLQRSGRPPLTLVLRPIENSELLSGGALVTVYDPGSRRLPSADLIAQYFSLSPAEARLCEDLVAGMSLQEAAAHRHKTEATLRSQLKQVFQKTGHKRQGALISGILTALMH